MNHNRRPMPKQARKAMEKEVKKGQKLMQEEDLPRSDQLSAKEILKKYPKKIQKLEKPILDSNIKNMQIKKKKQVGKHSKRSTPGEVEHRESPPAHIHPEGMRWEKTLVSQNKVKGKILNNKLRKRGS